MRKINEIFLSVQGEGCHTGVPSIFIRFSGCNLKCGFCDTEHENGQWMTDDEIINEITKYRARQIVLTGGEPSLQIDEKFINLLKTVTGLRIAIETNGTHRLPGGIDWVTVSPKFGMEGNPAGGQIRVTHIDELKIIDMGQDLEPYFSLKSVGPDTEFLLQPCYVSNKEESARNIKRTIERVLQDPRWRLSLQTHKLVGIP